MTDKPIIFSGPMVRALLSGQKTQTRRVLSPQPMANVAGFDRVFNDPPFFEARDAAGKPVERAFPYPKGFVSPYPRLAYAPGDRLYVREAHYLSDTGDYEIAVFAEDADAVREHFDLINSIAAQHNLTETWKARHLKLRPSIHMPRWASRLTLTVTDVRVQRLQEISAADSIAEGVECDTCTAMGQSACHGRGCFASIDAYRNLWNSLHGPDAWDENPWVVALTFTVQQGNIDQVMS